MSLYEHTYLKVTPAIEGFKDSPVDWNKLNQDQLQLEQARKRFEHNKAVEEAEFPKIRENEALDNLSRPALLSVAKERACNQIMKEIPDMMVSEAFAHIYTRALSVKDRPLEHWFIMENYNGLKTMAYMYIRKLGGIDYLRKRVMETTSPFLKEFAAICEAAAKKAVKKRAKKVMNSMSEEEVKTMMRPKPTSEEREELIKNIDELGADELATLISDKAVKVVRDETIREADEKEFRTVLKNDLADDTPTDTDDSEVEEKSTETDDDDTDDKKSKKKSKDKSDDDSDTKKSKKKSKSKDDDDDSGDDDLDLDDSSDDDSDKKSKKKSKSKSDDESDDDDDSDTNKSKKKKDKDDDSDDDSNADEDDSSDDKKSKKKSTKEHYNALMDALDKYDPVHETFNYGSEIRPRSFFFSLMTSIAKDKIRSVSEGYHRIKPEDVPKVVMESPLNMNIFDVFLQDKNGDLETISQTKTSDPQMLAGDIPTINKQSVLTEACVQYVLLEAAHTMKLIDVDQNMVRMQADFFMKE